MGSPGPPTTVQQLKPAAWRRETRLRRTRPTLAGNPHTGPSPGQPPTRKTPTPMTHHRPTPTLATALTTALAAALAALALTAAGNAQAQTSITQDKALAGAVTPGDTAGFPVTITQPGSYRLMSNLLVPAGTNGIEIKVNNVSLDLNGFAILGPGSCSRDDGSGHVVCTVQSGAAGISGPQGLSANVQVRNGSVEGFGWGVSLSGGTVQALRVRHNQVGVVVNGLVSEVQAMLNNLGVFLIGGHATQSVATLNDIGFGANSPDEASVQASHASFNRIGMSRVSVQASLAKSNKTNTSNAVAY